METTWMIRRKMARQATRQQRTKVNRTSTNGLNELNDVELAFAHEQAFILTRRFLFLAGRAQRLNQYGFKIIYKIANAGAKRIEEINEVYKSKMVVAQ